MPGCAHVRVFSPAGPRKNALVLWTVGVDIKQRELFDHICASDQIAKRLSPNALTTQPVTDNDETGGNLVVKE